ncbi:hypothetical protein A3D76_03180 [Candidatus Roizmanbacteria bacterium RIFCSPHIGHO2_02_FULL_37_9b]|nr:MAG: hypothetical protein A3D76_03180 [Candidatus Roizmanbacteria bacterium RIFCSPHIGHO2_02_FULL_37_9b]
MTEFYDIKIYIFYDDHQEMHFHAFYQGDGGEFSVKTGKLIAGKLPPRAVKLISEMMNEHKKELKENWKLAEQHKRLKKINPLKKI